MTCYGYRTTLPGIPLSPGEGRGTILLAILACTNGAGDLLGLVLTLNRRLRTSTGSDVALCLSIAPIASCPGTRVVYISDAWLKANLARMRIAKVYVSHHPPHHTPPVLHELDRRLFYTGDVPFTVFVSGWCRARLARHGCSIERVPVARADHLPHLEPSRPPRDHRFILRTGSTDIEILVGTCACPAGGGRNRLSVQVKRCRSDADSPGLSPLVVPILTSSCVMRIGDRDGTRTKARPQKPSVKGRSLLSADGLLWVELDASAGEYCEFHRSWHPFDIHCIRRAIPPALQSYFEQRRGEVIPVIVDIPTHEDHVDSWTIAPDSSQASKTTRLEDAEGQSVQALSLTLRPWVQDVRLSRRSGKLKFWSIRYCLDAHLV
ncbi:hypothetical protein BV20DRAFT_1051029 [Pilatotrama ljubarskyi]|nr:hypothetical protein BV20DRAFT_1051029 [Pilatotrama ljubarskyi]